MKSWQHEASYPTLQTQEEKTKALKTTMKTYNPQIKTRDKTKVRKGVLHNALFVEGNLFTFAIDDVYMITPFP